MTHLAKRAPPRKFEYTLHSFINISRFELYTPCKEDATKEDPGVTSKLVAKVLHAGHKLCKK